MSSSSRPTRSSSTPFPQSQPATAKPTRKSSSKSNSQPDPIPKAPVPSKATGAKAAPPAKASRSSQHSDSTLNPTPTKSTPKRSNKAVVPSRPRKSGKERAVAIAEPAPDLAVRFSFLVLDERANLLLSRPKRMGTRMTQMHGQLISLFQ
jgi:hypothetical protein